MRLSKNASIIVAVAGVLVLSAAGLTLWLSNSPLVVVGTGTPGGELFDSETAVGRVFDDVQACGEQQKNLYLCIAAYKEEHGRCPEDMKVLINGVREAVAFRGCPARLARYEVHFENFGNPQAVLIEEIPNRHPTAFKLWIRGITPHVQTMGDGTIHLFKDGKLATINAVKKN